LDQHRFDWWENTWAAIAIGMSSSSSRADQRSVHQLRPFDSERSLLNRADGSAKFSQGSTQVMAAVYGPMAANARQEKIERATIEVTFTPLSGSAGPAEAHKSSLIRQCVETIVLTHLHPRAKISVAVQVLRDDGSLLAASLNCVCLALMDAGVQCGSMLSAVCLAVSKQGAILLDPTAREEEDALCVVTTAFRSTDQQLVLSEFSGAPLDEAIWPDISRLGKASGEAVIRFFRALFSR